MNLIPINEELKSLGVTKFVKDSYHLQLVFKNEIAVIFNIHRGRLLETIENLKVAR